MFDTVLYSEGKLDAACGAPVQGNQPALPSGAAQVARSPANGSTAPTGTTSGDDTALMMKSTYWFTGRVSDTPTDDVVEVVEPDRLSWPSVWVLSMYWS